MELLLDNPAQRRKQIANGLAFMERLIAGNDGGQQIADLHRKYVLQDGDVQTPDEEKARAA